MVIRLKDTAKLFGITIIACCAVFVCTLFLSYNIDLAAIKDEIVTEAGTEMYNAQVLMGRVIAAVSGGCLIATSVVMLLFYVKNYISTHGKELGILKALGYSNIKIARHFWVFGLSVFVGCAVGFVMGYLYLPTFYQKQAPNLQTLIPALKVQFHPLLTFALVGAPTIAFAVISVLFAYLKLKSPVLDLLRERQNVKVRIGRDGKENVPFLKDLRGVTLRSKKSLVFFVAFSAFCFSAMVQMSFSMDELASETFAVMVLSIGLILAFVTLFLSLSSVVKGNTKTIAMMRVFGYDDTTCSRCILGAYRPISYIGFAFGKGDIFSLGKVLWCMINGEPEDFMPSNFWFVDEYDLTKRFPGNADMIVANTIIASCLNIAPDERCAYSSLIGQIENFIAEGNMTPGEEEQYRVRVYQEKRNLELLEIKEKNRLIVNSFSQYYIKALEELLNTYPDFELIQKLYDEYRKNSKDGIDYTSVNVENNASHYLYSGTYDRIYFSINYEPARGTDRYCSITIKYTIDSWKTIRFYYSEDGTILSDHNGVVKLMCVESLYNILNSIIMEYIS